MKKKKTKKNLLVELAKQKAEAQKNGLTPSPFRKFNDGKSKSKQKLRVGPSWGGRNGQGKP